MMNRRTCLVGLTLGIAAPLAAGTQQTGKIWRIGLLDYASDPASSSRWTALRDRLREFGDVEGQNALFESRWSETAGSEPAAVVRQATSSTAVVLATGGDLVAMGVVPSLARPGGNVTGVISMTTELELTDFNLPTTLDNAGDACAGACRSMASRCT